MFTTRFLIIIISLVILSCNNSSKQTNEGFNINAEIKGLEIGTAILGFSSVGRYHPLDSVGIENGKFQFKGALGSPRKLSIHLMPGNYVMHFYAGDEEVKITGNIKDAEDFHGREKLNIEVTGSRMHDEVAAFEKMEESVKKESDLLYAVYDSLNLLYKKAIAEKRPAEETQHLLKITEQAKEAASSPLTKLREAYIKENTGSHLSASFLLLVLRYYYSYHEIKEVYESFSPEVQFGFYGQQVRSKLEKLKKASPGAKATDFATVDINGDSLRLSDFRDQYVLIDFWASWCRPCRLGNPHLLDLYTTYHDKGFEIIGISSDFNSTAWHKAVNDDKIGAWKQVLKSQNEDSEKLKSYEIATLPTKILINPDGMIIGRYGGSEEDDQALDHKLAEIFN